MKDIFGREKDSMGELDPASTYLTAVLSGKPWPRTQSRPLMSPTNYQDVLQAGSVFFLTVIHAISSLSQPMTGPHVKLYAKICEF